MHPIILSAPPPCQQYHQHCFLQINTHSPCTASLPGITSHDYAGFIQLITYLHNTLKIPKSCTKMSKFSSIFVGTRKMLICTKVCNSNILPCKLYSMRYLQNMHFNLLCRFSFNIPPSPPSLPLIYS